MTVHIPTVPPPLPPRPSTAIGRVGAIVRPAAGAASDIHTEAGSGARSSASGWFDALVRSVLARPVCG